MIQSYHRPSTLDEALALLAAGNASVLGGGTVIVPLMSAATVVDLQDLALDGIELVDDQIAIGSMTRLRDVVESDLIPQPLRDLTRREAPSTIRNAATVGGTVAASDPESELLAGLLAYRATVAVADSNAGRTALSLTDYLETRPAGIITSITVPTSGGVASAARTGRTPADRPIVSAVARRDDSGATTLALTGVAPTPITVDPGAVAALDPPSDFRGTATYRRHLAKTLSARAIAGLDT